MELLISVSARSESAGRTRAWFNGLTKKEQKAYLAKKPDSKFGRSVVKKLAVKAKPVITADKAKKVVNTLSKRDDSLNDKLAALQKLQKSRPTAARKAKIAALKLRMKDLAKEYSKHSKIVYKDSMKKRSIASKADPKRFALTDKVDQAERNVKSIKANNDGGPSGARKVEAARTKLDKARAALKKYDDKAKKAGIVQPGTELRFRKGLETKITRTGTRKA